MLRLTIFRNEFKNLLITSARSSIRLRLFSDNWCPEEAASSSTSTRFVTLPTSKSFKATSSSQSGWSCIIRIRSSWSRRRRTPRLRDRSQSVGPPLPNFSTINFNVTLAQSFDSNSPLSIVICQWSLGVLINWTSLVFCQWWCLEMG